MVKVNKWQSGGGTSVVGTTNPDYWGGVGYPNGYNYSDWTKYQGDIHTTMVSAQSTANGLLHQLHNGYNATYSAQSYVRVGADAKCFSTALIAANGQIITLDYPSTRTGFGGLTKKVHFLGYVGMWTDGAALWATRNINVGWGTTFGAPSAAGFNVVYFRNSSALGDGNTWWAITQDNIGTTATDTTVAVSTTTTLTKLNIVFDVPTLTVNFYVNNVLRATHTGAIQNVATFVGQRNDGQIYSVKVNTDYRVSFRYPMMIVYDV